MTRLSLPFIFLVIAGCVSSEYRFERVEGGQSILLPLKFDSLYGVRDGYSVNVEARFTDGHDFAQMSLALHLGVPVQFTSGTYRITIGGRSSEGKVDADSVSFLGGQTALPSVGGVYILKDAQNRPAYRVKMPPTPVTRRLGS